MTFDADIAARLAELHTAAPDSIGDLLHFELLESNGEGEYLLRCATLPWMRNPAGTLHGGICATVLDQAMGLIAYCVKPGPGFAPTIEMQVSYIRPVLMGQSLLTRVHVTSVTSSLIRLRCELMMEGLPDRVCVTGSAVYFYKPGESKNKFEEK